MNKLKFCDLNLQELSNYVQIFLIKLLNQMNPESPPRVKSHHYILGCAKAYFEDSITFLENAVATYGDIFEVRMAHKKVTIINKPEYVQHILQKNQKNYHRHYAYDVLKLLFRDGIITVDGDVWKRKRRLMQPYFYKKSTISYFSKINQYAIKSVQSWQNKEYIQLLDEMGKLTLNVITGCVLGGSIEEKSKIIQENLPFTMGVLIERILSPLQLPIWFPTKKHRKFKKCALRLGEMINEIIKERELDTSSDDFITMYLTLGKNGENITSEDIFDEVMSVVSAGHESTAIALFVLICNVLQNENIKKRVLDEYDEITQGKPLQSEHLDKLTYVNKVIKEANRLSTPAWSIGRAAINDDIIDGYKIKKGTSVIISPYLMHRSESLWPDPYTFNPDRFDEKLPHNYAYIPFGGGAKMCIGMGLAELEMQIILYHVLKSECKLDDNVPPIKDMTFDTKSLTLRPSNDIIIIPSNKKYSIKSIDNQNPPGTDKSEISGTCPYH